MLNDSKTLSVSVDVPKADAGKHAPKLRVYLFDAAQRLVASEPAKERVDFRVDPSARYRVTVGPDLLTAGDAAPAALARQLRATSSISRDYSPQLQNAHIAISASSSAIAHWHLNCVNVHGSVRKLLNPGGDHPRYAPITTGTVQVFRIDFACSLDRLSAADLTNLKSTILGRLIGREITDILVTHDLSDFGTVNALFTGLWPLNGAALKSYIVAHRTELAPFMCEVIPEWDICYEQYPDAPIQSDGTFSTDICFPMWESVDLYFEVVQTVDGVPREIADPDIVCTTMFDYDGSRPAVITVTDPSAIASIPDPLPGPSYLYVWPTAIGNQDLRQIDGLLTGLGTGLLPGSTGPVPWGGTLPLQMQFDPDLRAHNIRYYRWSYSFGGAFTQVSTPVTHRWQEITHDAGGVVIHLHGYNLGPHLVGGQSNLFEIPDPTLPWIDINDPADRPFAYVDSTDGQTPGAHGMCTLKLEMFNDMGVHLPCNTGGADSFAFLLPDPMGAPDTYRNVAAGSPNIDADGNLIFRLYVDNRPTRAALYDAFTASNGSGDACGIRHYNGPDDDVTIKYAATQPENFLDWSLSVNKGNVGQVAGRSGHTSSADPDYFTNDATDLLGTCVQAAFAVNLSCAARATNGYGTQTQYNSYATMAFALLTP